ncbi:MAG: DUF559 domain-containing protein [Candidatus Dadabacteria bacterium]|nr:DUF559 domain-containing protein [Candidatus Dadabacteria bacterium]
MVTAKTPRALHVLHDQLPEQIRPLCINLLGSGIEEQRSLDVSVNSILIKQDSWNVLKADKQIEECEDIIHKLKKERAEIDFKLQSIREAETFEHSIIDGKYNGTASKITLQLRDESNQFSWFNDKIPYDQHLPLNPNEIDSLIKGLNVLEPEIYAELELLIPDTKYDLPSVQHFGDLVNEESDAKDNFSSFENFMNTSLSKNLERADLQSIQLLLTTVMKLKEATDNVNKRPMPWIRNAVYDMLTDNDTPWKELLRIQSENLEGLKERAERVDHLNLTAPPEIHRKKLLLDAKYLNKYLDEGGKLSWWIFKSKSVRDKKYITEKVQIDGTNCNSSESLKILIEYLEVRERISHCWKYWEGKATRKDGSLILQIAELEELNEALSKIVQLYDLLESAKGSAKNIYGLSEPAWHDGDSIRRLLDTCTAIIAKNKYESIQNKINQIVTPIRSFANRPNIHTVVNNILLAMENRDVNSYTLSLKKVDQLRYASERARITRNIINKLSEYSPALSKDILNNPSAEEWEARLIILDKAWAWARGNSWMIDFLGKEDERSLQRQRIRLEQMINNSIGELSAMRAWKFCFERMQENHRSHLEGWQQAMSKLGKGTGKHAPKHRRNAQRHLNECKDAVPAWVMPLHRVYETVKPAPGIFDVIIVDEASQCGFESLPLTYLCKKLIVVGDDQQISPEAPGVSVESIQGLIRNYLYDFKHQDSFDLESSLFHHAKRRFHTNRIVLREHFRCMPEIIRFSNDLCYSATPLIPLRQYPPNRLEPIMRVHVADGYRDGTSSYVINRPEAEKIADIIADCCEDKRYDGKTMGVISLQGDAQSSLMETILLERLGAEEIVQRRIICGNPYSFQGDERDIIFLSMVAAENMRIGPLTKEADKRRFNVAASRARDQIWLIHSVVREKLNESCMRRRLLDYFMDPYTQIENALGKNIEELRKSAHLANRQIESPPDPYESWFEVDVALELASRGFRVIPQYPFAGKRIDLVVEGNKSKLAVECDGDRWHGLEQYEQDTERQRVLERCGWRFYRIRGSLFYSNPEYVLNSLWQELDELGIQSVRDIMLSVDSSHTNSKEKTDYQTSVMRSEEGDQDSQMPANEIMYPDNIKQAISMKPIQLRKIIVDTLKERPNLSCVKDTLHGFVLARMKIITRGKPRESFQRKINRILNQMEKEGEIRVYKSKNIRVQLVH